MAAEKNVVRLVVLFIAGLALFLAGAWNPFGTVKLGPIEVPLFYVELMGGFMVVAAWYKLREVV